MSNVLITNISWNRTYLHIEYTASAPIPIYLADGEYGQHIEMICTFPDDDSKIYHARLNITIAEGRELLSTGLYSFWAEEQRVESSNTVLENIENISRVFRYSGSSYAYVVTFEVKFVDEQPYVYIRTSFMMENDNPKRRRPFFEGKQLLTKVAKFANKYAMFAMNILYLFLTLFRVGGGNNILFMSENRYNMSENLVAVERRLIERGLDLKYKKRTSVRNIFGRNYSVFSWLHLLGQIAQSDYIFIDDYTPIFAFLTLRKTKLVQVWHAGFGFKLVGYGRFGIQGSPHPFEASHRKYTYGIVGCEELKEIYTEVWGIDRDSLIASGMPRLDHFLDDDVINSEKERLYAKFPVIEGKKTILFAPTYRGYDQKSAYYDFDEIDFEKFYSYAQKKDAMIIFKMHHFIDVPVPIPAEYSDRMIEIADEDINSLFYVSDVLITDYSSCFYDYSLLGKPMLFFAYDKAVYFATRGVHRKLEQVAPGGIYTKFSEIVEALESENYTFPEREDVFVDRAAFRDGLASDIIIDTVFGINSVK
jgi:CDP-ribitol ribitolphosphotransferase